MYQWEKETRKPRRGKFFAVRTARQGRRKKQKKKRNDFFLTRLAPEGKILLQFQVPIIPGIFVLFVLLPRFAVMDSGSWRLACKDFFSAGEIFIYPT